LAKPRIELGFAQIFDEFKAILEAEKAISADFSARLSTLIRVASARADIFFNNTLNSTTNQTSTTTLVQATTLG